MFMMRRNYFVTAHRLASTSFSFLSAGITTRLHPTAATACCPAGGGGGGGVAWSHVAATACCPAGSGGVAWSHVAAWDRKWSDNHRRQFSSRLQSQQRRRSGDDKHAVDKHFTDAMNKYLDYEDNSTKSLEKIEREQHQKIYSIRRARAARHFKDDPENRTLSWDTIDQIRYLCQENPDEWSISALAKSFNVSEEVISKVLKSKFTPKIFTREKQDRIAAENSGYLSSKSTDKSSTSSLIESESSVRQLKGRVTSHPPQSHVKEKKSTHAPPKQDPQTAGHDESKSCGNSSDEKPHSKSPHVKSLRQEESLSQNEMKQKTRNKRLTLSVAQDDEEKVDVEFSFGRFDFENVDKLMREVTLKPQVIRKGRNVYNEKGEFLYRI